MKKIFMLAYHNILRDLKQPLVLLSTLVISICLILISFVSINSFFSSRMELSTAYSNSYDLAILDVKYENYDKLKKDNNINYTYAVKNIGYSLLKENNLNIKKYSLLQGLTKFGFEKENFSLIEGKLPENENEILIPYEYSIIYNKKVNDDLFLKTGTIFLNNRPINEIRERNYTPSVLSDDYQLKEDKEKVYKIVGIYENSGSLFVNNSENAFYYMFTRLDNSDYQKEDLVDVMIKLNATSKIDSIAQDYSETLEANYYKNTNNYNNVYAKKDNVIDFNQNKLVIFIICFICLIAFCFYSIKTALEYHNNSRRIYYRQLMSLGATSIEIKSSWRVQTYLIMLLALPLGICISVLLLFICCTLTGSMSSPNALLDSIISFKYIIITVLILIVLLIFANRASESNILYLVPLEAIKAQNESIIVKFVKYDNFTKLKGEIDKYIKSNFALKHIFSQVFVTCLALSIALFVLFTSINVKLSLPVLKKLNTDNENITLKVNGEQDYYDLLNTISKAKEVKKYSIFKEVNDYFYIKLDDSFVLKLGEIYKRSTSDNKSKIPINIMVVKDEDFPKYFNGDLDIGKVNKDEVNNYNAIASSNYVKETTKRENLIDNNILENNSSGLTIFQDKEEETRIVSISKFYATSLEYILPYYKSSRENIIMKESYFDKHFEGYKLNYNMISLSVTDVDEFLKTINGYLTGNNYTISIVDNSNGSMPYPHYAYISIYSMFILLILSLVLFIMTINQNMNTYVASRTKEIGLLKSIGISGKQAETIILKEFGRNYLFACIFGVILGIVITKILPLLFQDVMKVNGAYDFLIILVLIIYLIVVFFLLLKKNTKKIKESYPMELIGDNFKEF